MFVYLFALLSLAMQRLTSFNVFFSLFFFQIPKPALVCESICRKVVWCKVRESPRAHGLDCEYTRHKIAKYLNSSFDLFVYMCTLCIREHIVNIITKSWIVWCSKWNKFDVKQLDEYFGISYMKAIRIANLGTAKWITRNNRTYKQRLR